MAKRWYIVHTYSGYERKVEKLINRLSAGSAEVAEALFSIKVPEETVVEVKDGKKKVVNKKFFPGYILLELDLPETGWKIICSAIRSIDGVSGFVGAARNQRPHPISDGEAKMILQKSGDLKSDAIEIVHDLHENDSVRITSGPFDTFSGVVEEVNEEKKKLRVMVGIFGRSTPVELDFGQVEKI